MHIERIVPGTPQWTAYLANHIVRYKFTIEHISEGKKVLDAACGVGYGSKYLADTLKIPITAVDLSIEAINIAKKEFSHPLIHYIQDDCEQLNKVTTPYSHVVSFETFEHLKNPNLFLKRVKDLLSPGGKLIMSTPNASVTSPDGEVDWQFHEKEYTASQLTNLLTHAGFNKIKIYGQFYSEIGKLRSELRGELHRLHHNPFIRLGKWIQKTIKGIHNNNPVLPERELDFEINLITSDIECEALKENGPFVLLVVCEK